MSRGHLIDATWPIVVLVCPQRFDEGFVNALGPDFARIFARQKRFALITDTRPIIEVPKPRERKQLAEWANQPDQLVNQRAWNAGSATIVQNALFRTVLQGLYWVWTPPAPQFAAKDDGDALTWCAARLAKEGIELPISEPAMRDIIRKETARQGSFRPSAH